MRTHPEAIGNRLELLFLGMNAAAATPEPRRMHKRPVRGIHQADDAVVDVRRQLAIEMRDFVLLAERRQLRWLRNLRRQERSGCAYIHPDIAIPLFARIMSRENSLHLKLVLID